MALTQWGDDWLADGRASVTATDAQGRPLDKARPETSGRPVTPSELRFAPGPGAKPETRAFLAMLAARRRGEETNKG